MMYQFQQQKKYCTKVTDHLKLVSIIWTKLKVEKVKTLQGKREERGETASFKGTSGKKGQKWLGADGMQKPLK